MLHIYKQLSSRFPKSHEFLKFSLVGGFNFFLDFGIYIGLTRFFVFWATYYLGANFISFAIATTSSFFLNKHFTFRNDSQAVSKQYLRFWVVALIYIVIVQVVMFLGVDVWGQHDIIVKIIASAIGMFWNFYAHKYWSFR